MSRQSQRSLWTQKLSGGVSNPIKKTTKTSLQQPKSYSIASAYRGKYILGIDPSLRSTGMALILIENRDQFRLVTSTCWVNPPKIPFIECLGAIHLKIISILQTYAIDAMAIEQTIYVQNFQIAQILGAVRGVIIGSAAARDIPISEYPPLRIKQAITGYGRASKEQMIGMVGSLLKRSEPLSSDEADAAAVAMCHAFAMQKGI